MYWGKLNFQKDKEWLIGKGFISNCCCRMIDVGGGFPGPLAVVGEWVNAALSVAQFHAN